MHHKDGRIWIWIQKDLGMTSYFIRSCLLGLCYIKDWFIHCHENAQIQHFFSSPGRQRIMVKVNVCLVAVAAVQIQQSQRWARTGRSLVLQTCTIICKWSSHSFQIWHPGAGTCDLSRVFVAVLSPASWLVLVSTLKNTAFCLDWSQYVQF